MTTIKKQILNELKKQSFPDLKLLFSKEGLGIAPEILKELLEKEKKEFATLIELENEKLHFDIFEDEGTLDYYWSLLNHLKNVDSSNQIRKVIDDFRPKIEDFANQVAYSKAYFEKLVFVSENHHLDDEQKRVLYLRKKSYIDRGINLDTEKQEILKNLNKKISKLSDDFNNHIVDDQENWKYRISDFEAIKNLPQEVLSTCHTPQETGQEQKQEWVFDADPSSYIAIMKYCSDRSIRKDFEQARNNFASSGKYDNRKIVLELLQVKRQKAELLGYNNYAEYSLNDKMAESPAQVLGLLESIHQKAKIKANKEIEELKKHFHLDVLESHDLSYYSTKMKEEKYCLNEKELKKYFEFESVLSYIFGFVKQFYGIEVKPIHIDTYNPDVRVYEIFKNDTLISYYFLDPFYRKTKRPGAWADDIRSKIYPQVLSQGKQTENVLGKVPMVVNVCNFQKCPTSSKAEEGKTTLSMRDVETIFHEFGHAIHEMLSESKYSDLDGFSVEWDFVELPSQLLENWVGEKDSLIKLASHVDTHKNIPNTLVDTLEELKTFMSGTFVVRQNEFAFLDMYLYLDTPPQTIEELDQKALDLVNKYGIWKRDENYKQYTSFGHIFGGGYAAGYYSYMWAEIIEADIFSRIKKNGMFDRKVGEEFITQLLGQGTRKPAEELFFDFMGRSVDNRAFMERKGLID